MTVFFPCMHSTLVFMQIEWTSVFTEHGWNWLFAGTGVYCTNCVLLFRVGPTRGSQVCKYFSPSSLENLFAFNSQQNRKPVQKLTTEHRYKQSKRQVKDLTDLVKTRLPADREGATRGDRTLGRVEVEGRNRRRSGGQVSEESFEEQDKEDLSVRENKLSDGKKWRDKFTVTNKNVGNTKNTSFGGRSLPARTPLM